jgi:TRAP transporter TAXI family solute receptor
MNPGTTSGRLMEFFFQALDIKPQYKLMGLGASPDALKSGVVKGWFKAGFKDAAVLDVEAAMDINILPVTPADIARMNEKFPGQGNSMMIPAGLFRAVTKDQLSFSYAITDFVRREIPNDVVYKVVQGVWEKRKDIVARLKTLQAGKFDEMYKNADEFNLRVPLHPGAIRFYEETLKLKVPAKLRPAGMM